MPITRSWQRELNEAEQAKQANRTDESRAAHQAMISYFRNYTKDALDGRVAAIDMIALASIETAYPAIIAAHEARIGHALDAATKTDLWPIVASEFTARRNRMRAALRDTQERLASPFSVFAR